MNYITKNAIEMLYFYISIIQSSCLLKFHSDRTLCDLENVFY